MSAEPKPFDSSCSKCKRPMEKPAPSRFGGSPINSMKMTITGYLCQCGNWNNLKRRKGWVKP